MLIGEHLIPSHEVFVIAEIGSNHQGSLAKAKDHIVAAKESGAHAVKFQSLNISKLYNKPSTEIRELHSLIDLEEEWHYELNEFALSNEILFSSSATYIDAVRILSEVSVSFLKVASAQLPTFPQLIEAASHTKMPLLLSTGISNYADISHAIGTLKRNDKEDFAILPFNSPYPTPYSKVHLGLIDIYKSMYSCPVGYSDHTVGSSVVLAAVARGADIIEKHFKLDENCESPDSPFSITPVDFQRMTKEIRNVKDACIDGTRVIIDDSEASFKKKVLYKLVLRNSKDEGDRFTNDDFDYLRSPHGINVSYEDLVVNNFRPSEPLKAGSVIEWRNLLGC